MSRIFGKLEYRKIRHNFPVTKKYIFFDNAGVAPVNLKALNTIKAVAEDICRVGYIKLSEWNHAIPGAREEAAKLINASSDEVAFVKNTSHGLSLVSGGLDWKRGDEIVINDQEFPANVYPWFNLKKQGVKIISVRSKKGRLAIADFKKAITPKTKLLSISSVEYSTGFKNNLAAIGNLCRKHGILFCVDGIQSLGAIPMDVKKFKIDFLAADGHKWMTAPEGIGIFYCRRQLIKKLKLVLVGWNTVSDASNYHIINYVPKAEAERFEEGSHNLIGIHALADSIRLLRSIGIERIEKWNLYLTDLLLEGLNGRGHQILSSTKPEERSAIISFTTGSKAKDKGLFTYFIKNKIILSLRAGGIRLSPHCYNTPAEIKKFFSVLDGF